jgi:hypothetical protein
MGERSHATRIVSWAGLALAIALSSTVVAGARAQGAELTPCNARLLRNVPPRSASAPTGSEFAARAQAVTGMARDALVRTELLAGNLPQFLRQLVPVRLTPRKDAPTVDVTVCVLPDYLALGSDADFVFVPMGLQAALEVAQRFGFDLPTPAVVDAIYAQSEVRLEPRPLPATDEMRSTAYFVHHNDLIMRERSAWPEPLGALTAGDKKDLVLSSRLWTQPGRVAIYGWHRAVHQPIQPLSTVHGARYADYSHGVRLVSDTVFVNGVPRTLARVLAEPSLAGLLTDEGPWVKVTQQLHALMTRLAAEPAISAGVLSQAQPAAPAKSAE